MLTAQDWIHIFAEISKAVESAKDQLNELDGAIGDGDHGVSMSVGYRAVREALSQLGENPTLDRVFITAGQAFLSASGGAIGPLMGTIWADSGKALAGSDHFGPVECVRMMETMEKAVVRRGKAKAGDKTMLDALQPAVVAAQEARDQDLVTILEKAAEAAELGARDTAAMIARVGRSSRLGERTLGHPDAGATSIALTLRTICEVVSRVRREERKAL